MLSREPPEGPPQTVTAIPPSPAIAMLPSSDVAKTSPTRIGWSARGSIWLAALLGSLSAATT